MAALGLTQRMAPPISLATLLNKRDKSKTRVMRCGICICTPIAASPQIPMPDYWFDRLFLDLDGVAAFFRHMSGGRKYIEWKIFRRSLLTPAQKAAADAGGPAGAVTSLRQAAKQAGILVDDFDRFIWVIDDGISTGGTTPSDVLIGALDLTPQDLSHELTHAFGLCPHADLSSYDDYGDQFCVMAQGPVSRSFENPRLTIVNTPFTHATTGPGVIAPYLYELGWLDYRRNVAEVPTSNISQFTGGRVITLFANQGAPPPDSNRQIALALGGVPSQLSDPLQYWIEYRHTSRFDRQINAPVVTHVPDAPADGVLVLHEVAFLSARCTGLHSFVRDWTGAIPGNRLAVPSLQVAVRIVAVDRPDRSVIVAIDALR